MLCGFLPFEDPDTEILQIDTERYFELPDFLITGITLYRPKASSDTQRDKETPMVQAVRFKSKRVRVEKSKFPQISIKPRRPESTFNTQVLIAQQNSSLADAKDSPSKHQYFAQTNQTVSSSMTGTSIQLERGHAPSEVNIRGQREGSGQHKQGILQPLAEQHVQTLYQRPQVILSFNISPEYFHRQEESQSEAKQAIKLSSILGSPRGNVPTVASFMGRQPKNENNSYWKLSALSMKEKLRILKNPSQTKEVLSSQQKQLVAGAGHPSKVRNQKVTQVVSLLNNTMPMPKLMIDLAAPSTGGSVDIVNTNNDSAEALFKNNLTRVAKNYRQNSTNSNPLKQPTLKKQTMTHYVKMPASGTIALNQTQSLASSKRRKEASPKKSDLQHSQINSIMLQAKTLERNKKVSNSAHLHQAHPYTIMSGPQGASIASKQLSHNKSPQSSRHESKHSNTMHELHGSRENSKGISKTKMAQSQNSFNVDPHGMKGKSLHHLDAKLKASRSLHKDPQLIKDQHLKTLSNYTYSSVQSMSSVKYKHMEDSKAHMRIHTGPFPVDWSTTQKPSILLENLKSVIRTLNCHKVSHRTKFAYLLTAEPGLDVEVELVQVQNVPFVSVIRIECKQLDTNRQKDATALPAGLAPKQMRRFREICEGIRAGLGLDSE